jgi:hypothetical protein
VWLHASGQLYHVRQDVVRQTIQFSKKNSSDFFFAKTSLELSKAQCKVWGAAEASSHYLRDCLYQTLIIVDSKPTQPMKVASRDSVPKLSRDHVETPSLDRRWRPTKPLEQWDAKGESWRGNNGPSITVSQWDHASWRSSINYRDSKVCRSSAWLRSRKRTMMLLKWLH